MKKFILGFMLIILCGCSSNQNSIEISGSTSMAPVMNKLGEYYLKEYDVKVNVNADGSSAGINAVENGVSSFGLSSRELNAKELKMNLNDYVLAIDALGVIQNEKNNVKNLTLSQLHDIFTGKILNWKEVGGIDLPIVIISREDGSGTRTAFEEKLDLYNDDKSSKVDAIRPVIVNSNGAVVENVKQKEGAIGYLSVGSIESGVKLIAVDNILPTANNIIGDKYPLARNFNVLYKKLDEREKKFLEFLKGKEAKKIIESDGLIVRSSDEN